jgi:pyrroline-5-carboxylate reductase
MPKSRPALPVASASIAFIGGGNMARSLIGGLLRNGYDASRISVAEPSSELRQRLAADFGVRLATANAEAAGGCDVILLAVKPQVMKTVCAELRMAAQATKPLLISIAAGIRSDQIDNWLGGRLPIVRCMPNTPALIGAGASALFANAQVSAKQKQLAESMLAAVGTTVWILREALIDTVTALSGSGPAYFFLLVELLEDAAVTQGLPRDVARELATQTCFGAGRMLREDGESPARLRERVTSPNGTTEAALHQFANDGLREVVARALTAATERGRSMSSEFGS